MLLSGQMCLWERPMQIKQLVHHMCGEGDWGRGGCASHHRAPNADAGVGIGMKRGDLGNLTKKQLINR